MRQYFEKQIHLTSKRILELAWKDPEFYCDWLAQTYYYVAHSTRLLALAAARFDITKDGLHQRFLKHCQEEKRHEELAILDLKDFGRKLSDFPEHPSTKNFYQTQYFWIEHVSPECFFGYIVALEGLAVTVGGHLLQKIEKNFPGKRCRFLEVHANEDPDHLTKAFEMLKPLWNDSFLGPQVLNNFEQALENYVQILKACEASAKPEREDLAA